MDPLGEPGREAEERLRQRGINSEEFRGVKPRNQAAPTHLIDAAVVGQYGRQRLVGIGALDDETTETKLTKAFLKSAEVKDGYLVVTLGM